jgi:hypothetical protein
MDWQQNGMHLRLILIGVNGCETASNAAGNGLPIIAFLA